MKVSFDSTTSIVVEWGTVDCRHWNGEITGYMVRYGVVGSSKTQSKMVSGDSSGGATTLSGLIRTVYMIQVAGVTSGGTGVYSTPIIFETPDSELTFHFGVVLTFPQRST